MTTHIDVPTVYRLLVVWEAAAVLRHDLRNKLASIRNASFYLRRKIETNAQPLLAQDARIPQFFELITTEIAAADAIIAGGMPTLGAEPRGESFQLADAVAGALAHLRAPAGVRVHTDGDAIVFGSRPETTIAAFCVIENAFEAEAVRDVVISCRTDRDRAVLEVRDDGEGLQTEPRRVLDHFYTTKPRRLGLGTNIARRMTQRSRGSFELDRVGERGVRAKISLPRDGAV